MFPEFSGMFSVSSSSLLLLSAVVYGTSLLIVHPLAGNLGNLMTFYLVLTTFSQLWGSGKPVIVCDHTHKRITDMVRLAADQLKNKGPERTAISCIYTCQLSRIQHRSPCTGHQISLIKSSYELQSVL